MLLPIKRILETLSPIGLTCALVTRVHIVIITQRKSTRCKRWLNKRVSGPAKDGMLGHIFFQYFPGVVIFILVDQRKQLFVHVCCNYFCTFFTIDIIHFAGIVL